MRSGHVQGLQVSEGLDGRLLVAVVWFLCTDVIKIITARETCVNQENESSWLCACATAHCTHMHFSPLYYRKLSEWFLKGFHFTLSKYQERKMILLSQHFYLDFHLSWGGSPLKYYQVKTNSERLHLETEQSSCLDRGDPKLPRCWGPLGAYKNHKWTFT